MWEKSAASYAIVFAHISLFRLVNALILQTQFDPDEYWQTLEPAYCLAFSSSSTSPSSNCAYTWEWTRRHDGSFATNIGSGDQWIEEALHGPVRSYVPVLPTYLFYKTVKFFQCDSTWVVARGPILLNAVIVAAPTDFAVYYIAQWLSTHENKKSNNNSVKGIFNKIENWALLASITNWFNGYCLIRTYSNSMETMLLIVGIAMLCPELFGQINATENTNIRVRKFAQIAFVLGGISVVIRFTALAAWVPLGFIIFFRRRSVQSGIYYIWRLCIVCGAFGVAIGCVVDRYFYGIWAIPFLGSFHFNVLLGE